MTSNQQLIEQLEELDNDKYISEIETEKKRNNQKKILLKHKKKRNVKYS